MIIHGWCRWNWIFRVTLTTLGSPVFRAGNFLVLRGLAWPTVSDERAGHGDLQDERGEEGGRAVRG
jgi:hypothetical protein